MKKVMFVLVALLLVSTYCFALESGPSNKVGYVKINCLVGNTAFGLPFKFWLVPSGNVPTYGTESTKPSSIVGTQTNCGTISNADRISVQGGSGVYAYRNTNASCGWAGTLETGSSMTPAKAYFYNNKTAATRTLVLAGEADTTAVGIPAVNIIAPAVSGGSASTPYSWRDPRDIARNKLNLLAATFTGGTIGGSDRVAEQGGTGTYFYYRTSDGTWQGTLPQVTAGKAYYIVNKHFGHAFSYQYVASGAAVTMPETPALRGDAAIQKVTAPPAVTPSVKNHSTADTKPTTSTK